MIAIGTNDGFVSVFEFNAIDQPTILIEHHVCHDSIQNINFTGHADDVIAIDQNGGIFLMAVRICVNIGLWPMPTNGLNTVPHFRMK